MPGARAGQEYREQGDNSQLPGSADPRHDDEARRWCWGNAGHETQNGKSDGRSECGMSVRW